MIRKKLKIWLLVADGAQAQLYDVSSNPVRIESIANGRFSGSRKMTRDLESDRPGVSFESVGGARHAIERRSNAHQRNEDALIEKVTTAVNMAVDGKKFDKLIVAAPARALAAFRKGINKRTAGKVHAQISSEWTKLPRKDIEERLPRYLTGLYVKLDDYRAP